MLIWSIYLSLGLAALLFFFSSTYRGSFGIVVSISFPPLSWIWSGDHNQLRLHGGVALRPTQTPHPDDELMHDLIYQHQLFPDCVREHFLLVISKSALVVCALRSSRPPFPVDFSIGVD